MDVGTSPIGDMAMIWQDIVKCQLCLGTMNDPRSLPCLHSYCYVCLEEWAKGSSALICPFCRSVSATQQISSLPADFKVAKLIETLNISSANSHPSPDRNAGNVCLDHQRPWELFCSAEGCLKPICYKCSITTHRNHPMAEIPDHFNSLLDDLSKVQLKTHETIGNLNSYSNKITKLETIGEKLKTAIDAVVTELLTKDSSENGEVLDASFKSQAEENFFHLHDLQARAGNVREKLVKVMNDPKASDSIREMHTEVNSVTNQLSKLCSEANSRIEKDMLSDEELEKFSHLCLRLLTVEKNGEAVATETYIPENGVGVYRPPKVKLVFKAVNFPLEHHVQVQDGACVENKMFIIDKSNHWAKAYDLGTGRYLYISHRQVVKNPFRLCALPQDHKLVLMELKAAPGESSANANGCSSSSSVNGNGNGSTSSSSNGSNGNGNGNSTPVNPATAIRNLSIVNLDLKKKEVFVPELDGSLWDVTTCLRTSLMYIVMKPASIYRQAERKSTKFEFMFEVPTSQPVSQIAVCPVSGNIAVANSTEGKITVFDAEGNTLWRYPDGFKVNFKRLQSIGYDLLGNLLAVDNYYQQVQIISKRGAMLKMLHGRGLKFTNPLCTVPVNADELAILAESGDVVVVDSYIKLS